MSIAKLLLNCSQCGGSLEVTEDMELFKCQHCGMAYMVERTGDSVRIVQLEEKVTRLEAEQTHLRIGALKSEWQQLIRERERMIREYKDWLDEMNRKGFGGLAGKQLPESMKALFARALELKREYVKIGGDDAAIIGMPNPVEIDQALRRRFPRYGVKLSLFGGNMWNQPEIRVSKGLFSAVRVICLPQGVKVVTWSRPLRKEIEAFLAEKFGFSK